jgi:hypothetical protein
MYALNLRNGQPEPDKKHLIFLKMLDYHALQKQDFGTGPRKAAA